MRDNNGVYTERLKKARLNKDISLREMAKLLGYSSPSSYMYIEKGTVQPSIDKINEISKILGKGADYFFKLNVQESQTKAKGGK